MAETFQKQVNAREADVKNKDNKKAAEALAPKPAKQQVEKELKVEAKSEEKAKVAEALRKAAEKAVEKAAAKPTATPATAGAAAGAAKPAPAAKPEAKPAEEKPVEKRDVVMERIYTIPLGEAYAKPAKKRAGRAVKILRAFLSRHMKSENVKISPEVNEFIEERGARSPAKSVRVNASKDKTGMVLAKLAGME